MIARIAIVAILVAALVAGVALYYLQIHAFYEELGPEAADGVQLVSRATGEAEAIPFEGFAAIDSDSSPIRFRACFATPLAPSELTENFVPYEDPQPLVAPGWFDCFEAGAVGTALEAGAATAFLGGQDVGYGIDRVVAVTGDGRGYAWHQINRCGEAVFDGDPAPEGCPPPPEGLQ